MKCPECRAAGETSRVYPGAQFSTCLYHQAYFDEGGVYHSHDPNWHSTKFSCSKGHEFGITKQNECPAPGCDFGGAERQQDEGTAAPPPDA